jgi:hypothetical protein
MVMTPSPIDDITNRLVFDWAGMTDDEVAEMKVRVTNKLLTMARVPGAFDVMANWSALADGISVSCDLADNRRFAQRSSWTIVVGKAMAIHCSYRKRFSCEITGRTPTDRLHIWMFYES